MKHSKTTLSAELASKSMESFAKSVFLTLVSLAQAIGTLMKAYVKSATPDLAV